MNPTSITWRPKPLLNYFRSRSLVNGNVNLIAPSITAQEQLWADYALPASGDAKDGYRFYVEGYLDGDKPYSYQNTSGKLDWTARSTVRPRSVSACTAWSGWFPGRARPTVYRSTRTMSSRGHRSTRAGWRPSRFRGRLRFQCRSVGPAEAVREALYAWRPIDVSYRVEAQCDLLYYFMQSSSFTPQLLAFVPLESGRAGRARDEPLCGGW